MAYAAPGSGPYWTEVALAAQSAMTAMGLSPPATAELGAAVPAPDAASVFVFDIDETALSNLPHITWNNRDAARAARLAAASPALMPVRELYLGLWRAGYSVAFITGAGAGAASRLLPASGLGDARWLALQHQGLQADWSIGWRRGPFWGHMLCGGKPRCAF